MAHDSLGTHNEPQYAETGVPADAADLTEIAAYAALVGNRKAGTSSDRTGLTGSDVWPGLEFRETDTALDYVYTSAGWVRVTPGSGMVTATTDASGLLNNLPHGMGATPSQILLTQYFTNDTSNVTALTKLTVGSVTSTTFQVVVYRMDTFARLLNTAVKFSWEALP